MQCSHSVFLPVSSSIHTRVHTHVQLRGWINYLLKLRPLIAAPHTWTNMDDGDATKLHLSCNPSCRTSHCGKTGEGAKVESLSQKPQVQTEVRPPYRCWHSWSPGKPAPPYSGWAAWHFSCGSRPTSHRPRSAGESPCWWGWRWQRGRRKWVCWTCFLCCWVWPPPSRILIRPPLCTHTGARDNSIRWALYRGGNFLPVTPKGLFISAGKMIRDRVDRSWLWFNLLWSSSFQFL